MREKTKSLFSNNISLKNQVITLRLLSINDIEDLVETAAPEASIWDYFTSKLDNKADMMQWILSSILKYENMYRVPLAIVYNQTGKVIGSTSYGNISERHKRIEIGWTWLGKEFQGKGINKNCKCLMINHAFERLKYERVEFKVDVLNEQARKALLNIGAVEEGVLRSHSIMPGNRRRDTIFYSILQEEWEGLKNTVYKDLL